MELKTPLFFIIFVDMKVLVRLKKGLSTVYQNIDEILNDNISSVEVFDKIEDLKIGNYIVWTMYLSDPGWCIVTKYPKGIEDPTLIEMLSETIDMIVINYSSPNINKSKSAYIRDIKLLLINDKNN